MTDKRENKTPPLKNTFSAFQYLNEGNFGDTFDESYQNIQLFFKLW